MKRVLALGALLLSAIAHAQINPSGNSVNQFATEQYGTHHDGTTDDAAAFTRAFAACTAAGGGTVVVGPFRYFVNSTITVPANCRLAGGSKTMPYEAFTPNYFLTQPYTLLLGSGVTVQLGSGSTPDASSAVSGLNIVKSGLTPATDMPSGLALVASFSGTAITIPHSSSDSVVENVVIAGFNQCMDVESFRPHISDVLGDCTNGALFNTVTDYSQVRNVVWQSILSGFTGADNQYSITAVANDGTGLAQITVSSITTQLANGNTVYLSSLGGRTDLNGKWTISNVAMGGSATTFSLVGSSFAGPSVTGAVVSGSPYVTGLSATSQLGYFGGQAVSDAASGNCIPAATTILWVNPDTNEMQLSANATCSSATDTVVVTAATYTSGGIIDFNAAYRSGYGFKITNSQGMFFNNVFDWGHAISYDIGTGSQWQQFTNYGCDGLPLALDPTRICILIEANASRAQFSNGVIVDAGIAIKENTTADATRPSIIDGPTSIEANKYLGAELLNGAIVLGPGVVFRSTQPNFIGDTATVSTWALNKQTASPQFLYQSAADTANISATLIGSLAATGNAGFGGEAVPASGIQALATGDSAPGLRVDSTTVGSGNNVQVSPTGINMNRTSGSSLPYVIKTTASFWTSSGGDIDLSPNGVRALRCDVSQNCQVTGALTVGSPLAASAMPPSAGLVLSQTGLPMILPPSGFYANNGILVIGQAPSNSATASFSATSGSVTMTFSAATLLGTAADVGRVLTILDTTYKQCVITAQSSTTVATCTLSATLSSTGAFANNAMWLTGSPTTNTTAFSIPLPSAYAKAYVYAPVNAIAAATAAGVYYATCSLTTVCTLFNNTYTSGTPAVPGSPTAFSTTGPGAYTQTVATEFSLITATLAANSLNVNGELDLEITGSFPNNANSKSCIWRFNGSSLGSYTGTTTTSVGITSLDRNNGVTGSQIDSNTVISGTGVAFSTSRTSIDTTSSQSIAVNLKLATATDFMVLEGYSIKVFPN